MNQRTLARATPTAATTRARRRAVEALEPRRFMDATSGVAGHVALIDASLPDYKSLAAAVADQDNVILYDGRRDTASAVLNKLVRWAAATKQQIHSVSILSHGAAGGFQLGKDWITSEAVQKKSWQKLQNVLADDASIYLFGCNVAADAKGEMLLDHLAALSGADVFGSTDLTGSTKLGGDWVLEASSRDASIASAADRAVAPLRAAALAAWDFSLAPGITVSPTSGLSTSESGGSAAFDIVLQEQPTGTVTIGLSSSDTSEGAVSLASVTFTPANWNVARTVTVTGVDDATDDGDVAFTVVTGAATSTDPQYSGLNAADVAVTNVDDDPTGPTAGGEFRVNTTTASAQAFSAQMTRSVAMDAAGNFVVVWASYLQDGSGYGIYGQRYSALGAAQGGEFRVNTTTTGDQLYRSVAMDAAGNFVVAWTSSDANGTGIFAQRYNALGAAQGGEFRVNTTTAGDQAFPTIAMDGAGNFIIAWQSNGQDGSGWGIHAQRYAAAGPAQGVEFLVNNVTTGDQTQPSIARAAGGAFVVVWTSGDDVIARRFDAAGAAQGNAFTVNQNTSKIDNSPAVAMDAAGNFVVAWNSNHQDAGGNRYGVFAQRYSAAGATLGNNFQVNTFTSGNQRYPSLDVADDGDFVVSWSSDSRDGSGWGVYAQQYASDGTPRGAEFRVNSFTAGDQQFASVALDANGDFVIVWSSDAQDGSSTGIYGQRYSGDNDAPINTLPSAAQSVIANTTLTFSGGNGNLIAVSDADAGGNALRVTLTATNGALTLSGTAGLTFDVGDGTGDSTMSFTGTLASINAALNGMTFTPAAGGPATVQITSNDLGNTGPGGPRSDIDTVNVTVLPLNVAPVNTVPGGAQATNEDTPRVFSTANGNRISIDDVDAGGGMLRVTLTATNGLLSLSGTAGLSFSTGDGAADATLVFTGTLASINAALDGLAFTPTANFNGVASLQLTTNDQGNTGAGGAQSDTDSVAITINAVNDAPVHDMPGPQAVVRDGVLTFGGANAISIVDIDAATGLLEVTLGSTNGTLTLASLAGLSFSTGDGTNDAAMVFTGTLAAINAALDDMTFAPAAGYSGPASISVATDDQGNTGAGGALGDSDVLNVFVSGTNVAPVNNLPPAQVVDEDTPLVFSAANGNAITITDVDAGSGIIEVTLAVSNGRLTLGQLLDLTFSSGDGTADAAMTFRGALADVNAALDGLTFTPDANYGGAAGLQMTTDDLGNTGPGGAQQDSDLLAITVSPANDAPLHVIPGAQSLVEDGPLTLGGANAIEILDLDAGGGLLQVTLTATNGLLTLASLAGLSFTTGDGEADAVLVFTGTLADLNAALDGLRFAPSANFNGAAAIAISTSDGGNTGGGGAQTADDTLAVSVSAVNDAPVNAVPLATQNVAEDTPLVLSIANGNVISVADVDGAVVRVTLTATGGRLSLAQLVGLTFTVGDGSDNTTMTFTGSLADINAALDGLRFDPNANYNGAASIAVTTSDLGSTGAGGARSDSDTVAITVNPVNDAPVNLVPPAQSVAEDGTLVFSFGNGNRILVDDIDAGSQSLRVTLTATNGTLTLAGVAGLGFTVGDGVDDVTMTFTGSVVEINQALEGLMFRPSPDFAGAAGVTITTNDRGNAGAGGALSDTSTIDVAVNAANDAPIVVTTPGVVTYRENDAAHVIDAGIDVTDIDTAALAGATVAIGNLVAGEDLLAFVDQNGITGSFDATTGVLTLSGVASVADYQAALRSVAYYNTSDAPRAILRTVAFSVNDGAAASNVATRGLVVTPVNDRPTATPLVVTLNEDAGRSSIDLWQLFADPDDGYDAITISVVGSSNPALFSAMAIDAASGQLHLDSATDAFGDAVVTIRATDAAGQDVDTTLTLNVGGVNDAPAVGTTPAPTRFDPAQPTYVDADLLISDADSALLLGATVRIVNYAAGVDVLEFADQNGVTGVFDEASGILTLTGSASVAQYEQALRSVRYTSAAGTRSGDVLPIEFSVTDDAGAQSTLASRPITFPSSPQVTPPPPPPPPAPEPEGEPEPEPATTPEPEPEQNEPAPPPVVRPPIPPRTAETTPPKPEAPLPPPPVPPPVVEANPVPAPRPADPVVVAPVVTPPPPPPTPVAPPTPPPVAIAQPPSEKLWQQLDVLAKELEPTNAMPKLNVGTVSGVSTTLLSVGYVIWCLRGGAFIGTLLTTLPLWRWLDPLPVLDARERKRKKDGQNDEDEERIRSMMD